MHTKALHTTESNRLQNSVILAWSTPRIAFGIMGTLFGVYLMKFATDVLMIAPAVMGTILALSRLWEGITDPLIGYLSDRTLSRFGRRRAWMFAAAVPMSITLVGIWSPPESLSALNLVVWMSVCLYVYYFMKLPALPFLFLTGPWAWNYHPTIMNEPGYSVTAI